MGLESSIFYCCPKDSLRLNLLGDGTAWACASGHVYPISDGVVRFCDSDYAASFGLQWNRFPRIQLDSASGASISHDRLIQMMGGSWEIVNGRQVLEVGSGSGRFTEILATHARTLDTTDLSNAIDANRSNCGHFLNVRFAQASIYSLPFEERAFDAGILVGVIQHTPSPQQALRSLASKVRVGGYVVVDFYKKDLSRYSRLGAIVARKVLLRLSPEKRLLAVTKLFRLFDPIHRRWARNTISYAIISRLSPVMSYYHRKWPISDELCAQWGHLDTHDVLTDHYKHLFSEADVRKLCASSGLEPVILKSRGNIVELLARVRA